MKHSLLRLSILALVLTINTVVFADEFEIDGIRCQTTSSSTASVVRYSQNIGNIIIPEVVDNNGKSYNVTSIGDYAFNGCSSLASVTSLNTTPPIIFYNTFDEVAENDATLIVPQGRKTIYSQQPYWEDFFNIVEGGSSAINNILVDVESGGSIYNLYGTKVDGNNYGKGIYIKNGKKVIIK